MSSSFVSVMNEPGQDATLSYTSKLAPELKLPANQESSIARAADQSR